MTEYYTGGGEKTVAKQVILEKYIKAYLNIIPNHFDDYWYIDSHSGTGYSEEFGIPIPGSTLRALDCDFKRYYFYEKNPENFEVLCDTIEEYAEIELYRGEREDGTQTASCDDPYIRVNNEDCNSGVSWLASHSNSHAHWFTFVDPEKLSLRLDLMEKLRSRGNMDILLNFQTDGFSRNAAEAADHSHEKIDQSLPDGWPVDGDADTYVRYYKREVFEEMGWNASSRKMVSEGDNNWRYDLIFASQNDTADDIMSDIMGKSLRKEVQSEIREWRAESDIEQQGFETWVEIGTHEEEESINSQSSLGSF